MPRAEATRVSSSPRQTARETDQYAAGKSLTFRAMYSMGKFLTGTPKGLPPRKTQVAETERAPAFSRRTSVTEAVRSINTVERPQPTDARMGVTYQRPEVTKLTPLNKRDQASPHYQPPLANFDRPAVNQSPPYTGGSTPHFPHFYGRK